MASNGGGGFKLGFGVSVSTGVFLVFAIAGVAAAVIGNKHGKMSAIKNSWGPGGQHDHVSAIAHAYAGNAPVADDVDEHEVMSTIIKDIQRDASNHHQVIQNIDRIMDEIHSHNIHIRPLVRERREGRITQADYIGKIGELEKQIISDLGVGVEPAPQVVNHIPSRVQAQIDLQGRQQNFFRPPFPSIAAMPPTPINIHTPGLGGTDNDTGGTGQWVPPANVPWTPATAQAHLARLNTGYPDMDTRGRGAYF